MPISEDYCKYVNVFQGNGEIDLPKPEGIARTWLLIKGQCGNTHPAAALPFGKLTCGPYTGGYPTGYGNHLANSCGGIRKFCQKLRGFSHIHQSGTGAAGIYYNYVVVTPLYGEIGKREYDFEEEKACPGHYSVRLKNGIFCETTVAGKVAYHRYTFEGGGKITVDFSSNGINESLCIPEPAGSAQSEIRIESDCEVSAKVVMQGVPLYIYVKCEGSNARLWRDYRENGDAHADYERTDKAFGCIFDTVGETIIKISISAKSREKAKNDVYAEERSFDEVKNDAYRLWNEYISAIEIDADEKVKEIFYSNFYHSLMKPSNWCGESFLYEQEDFYCDFVTLWDMYKTQLPLVFTLYKKESMGVLNTFLNIGEKEECLPVTLLLSSCLERDRLQARMLAEFAMADIFYRYEGVEAKRILRVAKKDFEYWRGINTNHITQKLDMAQACAVMAEIAEQVGEDNGFFAGEAQENSNFFDKETGLLSEDSLYYEGDNWNYSFRLLHDMEQRVDIAGGRQALVEMLDSFFGFTRERVVQPVKPEDYEYLASLKSLHSFEGFNNETDMETPYAYYYAGRHDRLCEVVRAGMKYMFTTGRGGLPGNNDSGALSSCYMWNAMGIFPVAGQDLMLIGSPIIKSAVIKLGNGKEFKISVHNGNDKNIYVDKAVLNGKRLEDMSFSVREMMKGGHLELFMK